MAYARFRVSGMRDVVRREPRVERSLDGLPRVAANGTSSGAWWRSPTRKRP